MLRTDALAHPNFEKSLSRRSVLVTTGRLVGGAPLAAQQYSVCFRQACVNRKTCGWLLSVRSKFPSGCGAQTCGRSAIGGRSPFC
jgi:hypothetical protein